MRLLLPLLFFAAVLTGQDQVFPVYTGPIPCANDRPLGSRNEAGIGRILTDVSEPELHYFAPIPRSGRADAVMIIPGGGYAIEAWDLEGTDIARYLSHAGYHAFVLSHRLPARAEPECRSEVALNDAQTGLLRIRGLADSLGFATDQVGVMGFSAGGHLAGSASVHPREEGGVSSRPAFSILVYPVTLMDADRRGHAGSQANLLGPEEDADLREYFHLPAQVDSLTPPTLLIHASDDKAVPPRNSLEYYAALQSHGVAADLRIYATGGHGFGAARERETPVRGWLEEVTKWLSAHYK
ncbi:acetyl esterase/lipase [Lewinella marina]|uniref:Esterase n=1 Tax=Neolewinella marina TaxID=438751 RepID=A0A2G0CFF7_9BACT|nr:alpha/beta hydrolase [Neolewinella marina]NJB85623.1 acetyl esterase/lipase [Neolewinella marina]PHK98692.1 esterase [Neolewinella marina]